MPASTLPSGLRLAATAWPRTGGGPGQAGAWSEPGPARGRVLAELALPRGRGREPQVGGLALCEDGDLLATHDGRLSRVTPDGRLRWSRALLTGRPKRLPPAIGPVALQDGRALAVCAPHLLLFDARGRLEVRLAVGPGLDDSGPSPNLTARGEVVLTRIMGEVELWGPRGKREVGSFGYDVLPPALYPDGSLAVAGYAGSGLVRVERDGRRRWRADLAESDLLPSINARGQLAGGSLNAKASAFTSPAGRRLGGLGWPAVFAALGPSDWIALSKNSVARVSASGRIAWQHRLAPDIDLRWGAVLPLVDGASDIYAPYARGVLALDARGRLRFRAALGAQPRALAPAGPGRLAALLPGRLVLLG